jgi:hypothetical protein
MSLEDWAAVAEIVGAIAVVATLIYLAIQVKQNTGAIQSSNAMVLHNNISELARDVSSDRDLGDVIVRALEGTNELSPADKLASYAWFFVFLKTGELAHMRYRSGELDKQYWDVSLVFFRAYWQTPGFRAYWADRKAAFTPDFRSAVEEWINETSDAITPADKAFRSGATAESQERNPSS